MVTWFQFVGLSVESYKWLIVWIMWTTLPAFHYSVYSHFSRNASLDSSEIRKRLPCILKQRLITTLALHSCGLGCIKPVISSPCAVSYVVAFRINVCTGTSIVGGWVITAERLPTAEKLLFSNSDWVYLPVNCTEFLRKRKPVHNKAVYNWQKKTWKPYPYTGNLRIR